MNSNKNSSKSTETGVKKRVNRKPKKRVAAIVAILIGVFVILVATVVGFLWMYKPVYEDRPTFITTDETGGVDIVITDSQGGEVAPERNQEQVNFLILGKDRWAFNTDVMIIASYNVTDGAISMMQIPRDTYIDVGRGNHKANSLLASFYNEALRNGEKDPIAAAIKGMEETFEKVFCITIDYYAMMDLNGFVNIVDALGGVEVDVPFDMKYRDPIQNLNINLKKGLQTLDGDEAEQFIRFRADYVEGDIGRVDAQKIFISACLNKVKNSFNVSTIAKIAEEVLKYVKTDIPLSDLLYYAKSALSVDLEKMTMLTLPGIQGRQYDTSGTWYYIVYRDGTLSAVNKYFNSYNFAVTAEIFDKSNALYDSDGTYMHSVFLTEYKEEESYTAANPDDIYIYKYSSTSKPSAQTTAAEETSVPETTDTTGDILETTADTWESVMGTDVHTETQEPDSTEGTVEITASVEPAETTSVIEVSEVTTAPEEPVVTTVDAETTTAPETTEIPAVETTVPIVAETSEIPPETSSLNNASAETEEE